MYNHNKAQQNKNRVHISWDILYLYYLNDLHNACINDWCRANLISEM